MPRGWTWVKLNSNKHRFKVDCTTFPNILFFKKKVSDPAEVAAHILRVPITSHHIIQFSSAINTGGNFCSH